jgi:hypothetical protein
MSCSRISKRSSSRKSVVLIWGMVAHPFYGSKLFFPFIAVQRIRWQVLRRVVSLSCPARKVAAGLRCDWVL